MHLGSSCSCSATLGLVGESIMLSQAAHPHYHKDVHASSERTALGGPLRIGQVSAIA